MSLRARGQHHQWRLHEDIYMRIWVQLSMQFLACCKTRVDSNWRSMRWVAVSRWLLASWTHPLLFYHVPVLPNRRLVGDWLPLCMQPSLGMGTGTLLSLHIREVSPYRWSGVWYLPLYFASYRLDTLSVPWLSFGSASVTKLWVA